VAIRVLGVYFFVEGVSYAVELASAIYSVYGPESVAWGANASDYTDKMIAASIRVGTFLVLYLFVGLYCLLAGKFLHRLVMRGFGGAET
jgi:hypothetical protein